MPINEKEVKEAVKGYLKEEKKFEIIEKEFDVGGAKADIAAFKWNGDYEIDAIAVECKGLGLQNILTLLRAAEEQARYYQITFPRVYLAMPRINNSEELKNLLKPLRVGLFSVNKDKKIQEEKPNFSLRLKWDEYFLKVRQRAAAIWTFKEVVKPSDRKIAVEYNPNGVACWTNEFANFLITNNEVQTGGDYHFGVNIEQQENVKRSIGNCDCDQLYNEKEAWRKYEALEKEEHLKRAKRIAEELNELCLYLLSLG